MTRRNAAERFAEQWMPEPNTGCWLWLGGLFAGGYGRFFAGGRSMRSHRYAWELTRGPIPAGLVIDHMCRQRSCCNPDHLRVVTPRVNALENSLGISAVHAAKSSCPRCASPFSGRAGGGRYCAPCRRVHAKTRVKTRYHTDPAFREEKLRRVREWAEAHREEIRAYQKQYREAHKVRHG